jgi:hypothetical protein
MGDEKDLEGNGCCLIEVPSQNLPGGGAGRHGMRVRMAGVGAGRDSNRVTPD